MLYGRKERRASQTTSEGAGTLALRPNVDPAPFSYAKLVTVSTTLTSDQTDTIQGPDQAIHPAPANTARKETSPGQGEPERDCGPAAKEPNRDGEAEGGGVDTG